MIILDTNKAEQEGYNGFHHCHIRGGYGNYALNFADRARPKGWINLLTFNLPHEPEVIGYNHHYIYVPHDSKTHLVRANKKQLRAYIEKQ